MTVLKAYDEGTEEWQTIVVGRQGPAGVVQADLPITYDADSQTVGSDGSLLVTVEHGGDDSEPRPSYAATVYWKGTVAPVNGVNGDLWYDSTGDV
jgi:hypothetical protein